MAAGTGLMTGAAPAMGGAERGDIDIKALFGAVIRHKWTILVPTLVMAVLATVLVNMVTPRFTAETRVLLESRETEFTRPGGRDAQRGSDPTFDEQAVMSQVQLVLSRDIARLIIRRHDLGSRVEFDPLVQGMSPVTRLLVLLGLMSNPADMTPEERVLERYYDRLRAFSVARSRVIAIEFTSRDPELAAAVARDIAEEYLRRLAAAKKDNAMAAGSWLGRTIEALRERVATAEAKVEAFRARTGLFVGNNNTGLSAQQLAELNAQVATARAQQAELSARARTIREAVRSGRAFETSEVVRDEVVRRLIENRAGLIAQIAQEERTLLPAHPRLRELQAQLGALEGQIRAAAERAARALENDARTAGERVASIERRLDEEKRSAGSSNAQEVELRALEREAKAEREQLELYLARWRDASVRDTEAAVVPDARIVSQPIVPSAPSFPKKIPIILIATLATLAIMTFWVLTRELMSGRAFVGMGPAAAGMPVFAPTSTVGASFGLALRVAAVPVSQAPAAPAPVANELDESLARLKALLAPVPRESPPAPQRVTLDEIVARMEPHGLVAVLSDGAAQAGFDAALALARALARRDGTVLMACDPRAAMPVGDSPGLADVLAGAALLVEALTRDPASDLHILPPGGPCGLIPGAEARLAAVVAALRSAYPAVVVHIGPCTADVMPLLAEATVRVAVESVVTPPSIGPVLTLRTGTQQAG